MDRGKLGATRANHVHWTALAAGKMSDFLRAHQG